MRLLTTFRLLATAGSIAALAPLAAAAQEKLTWQMAWLPTGEYAAYTAGIEKGFFLEQGIELTMTRGFGSGDTVAKIASGASVIGDADLGAMMTAAVRTDAPVKAVMAGYTVAPNAFFVMNGSGIETIGDLAGKVVGTTPGNSSMTYLPSIAEANGLDLSSITFVTMDGGAMGPMLINGRIDAAPFYTTHHFTMSKQAAQMGKTIDILPFADYGLSIYSSSFLVNETFLEEKPELVKGWLAGIQKSLLWAKDNPEEAARIHVAKYPEVDFEDALANLETVLGFMLNESSEAAGLGQFAPEQLASTWAFVAQSQELDPAIDPAVFVDTSLVP